MAGGVPTIPTSHALFTPFHNARWAWWSSPPLGLRTPEKRVKGGGTSLAPPREALYCGVGLKDQAPLDGPDTAKAEDWSTASLYWWGMEDQLPTRSQQRYPCKGNETC